MVNTQQLRDALNMYIDDYVVNENDVTKDELNDVLVSLIDIFKTLVEEASEDIDDEDDDNGDDDDNGEKSE